MQMRRRLVRHVGAVLPRRPPSGCRAYALDFLLRARDQQMAVPAASLQRGLTWLNRTADKLSPNAQAYAWYVLAKAGLADAGRVRYFQDTKRRQDQRRPRLGQLAAALNLVGEPGRARLAFGIARQRIDERDPQRLLRLGAARPRRRCWRSPRKPAAATALPMVMASVRERLVAKVENTTTQEQAWLVLAARALAGGGELRLLGRRRGAEAAQPSRS